MRGGIIHTGGQNEQRSLIIDAQTFAKTMQITLSGIASRLSPRSSRAEALHREAQSLGISESSWVRIKGIRERSFPDQMTRASAAIGIVQGLHILFADTTADRWPKLPNRGADFSAAQSVDARSRAVFPQCSRRVDMSMPSVEALICKIVCWPRHRRRHLGRLLDSRSSPKPVIRSVRPK